MKIQVISKDEYGTTVIRTTVLNLEEAIEFMNSEVTDANFQNALTTVDKFKAIEAYVPMLVDEEGELMKNFVYAGNHVDGKHRVYEFDSKGKNPDLQVMASQGDIRIYLGSNEGEEFFLTNVKDVAIDSLSDEVLEGKTQYFVRVI